MEGGIHNHGGCQGWGRTSWSGMMPPRTWEDTGENSIRREREREVGEGGIWGQARGCRGRGGGCRGQGRTVESTESLNERESGGGGKRGIEFEEFRVVFLPAVYFFLRAILTAAIFFI